MFRTKIRNALVCSMALGFAALPTRAFSFDGTEGSDLEPFTASNAEQPNGMATVIPRDWYTHLTRVLPGQSIPVSIRFGNLVPARVMHDFQLELACHRSGGRVTNAVQTHEAKKGHVHRAIQETALTFKDTVVVPEDCKPTNWHSTKIMVSYGLSGHEFSSMTYYLIATVAEPAAILDPDAPMHKGSSAGEEYGPDWYDGDFSIHDFGSPELRDVLNLSDYSKDDVRVEYEEQDLIVIMPEGKRIRLIAQRREAYFGVEEIRFAEGETLQRDEMSALAIEAQKEKGDILGSKVADDYRYSLRDGSISITDLPAKYERDTLTLVDATPQDIRIEADGSDLVLVFRDWDTVRLVNQRGLRDEGIEAIIFSDGVEWSRDELYTRALHDMKQTGQVRGTWWSERYEHATGDGSYAIDDQGHRQHFDTLVFQDLGPDDITLRIEGADIIVNSKHQESIRLVNQRGDRNHGIDKFVFVDGTTWERGDLFTRALHEMKSTGLVEGSYWEETYVHRLGEGSYEIRDDGYRHNWDTLELEGVEPAQVELARDGDDLLIRLPGAEEIRVLDQFVHADQGLDFFRFPDGSVWNRNEIAGRAQESESNSAT